MVCLTLKVETTRSRRFPLSSSSGKNGFKWNDVTICSQVHPPSTTTHIATDSPIPTNDIMPHHQHQHHSACPLLRHQSKNRTRRRSIPIITLLSHTPLPPHLPHRHLPPKQQRILHLLPRHILRLGHHAPQRIFHGPPPRRHDLSIRLRRRHSPSNTL